MPLKVILGPGMDFQLMNGLVFDFAMCAVCTCVPSAQAYVMH